LQRGAILLVGLAALSTPAQLCAGGVDSDRGDRPGFAAPTAPLVLTRTVWRNLRDGQQVVARRSYRVTFTPDGEGYRVTAELTGVTVEAPPALAALAELERNRDDGRHFNLKLDRTGRICGVTDGDDPASQSDNLAAAARTMLASAHLDPATRAEGAAMLARLTDGQSGAVALPPLLFNPPVTDSRESRALELPGGTRGQIDVILASHRSVAGGLPDLVSRTVVTTLEGTQRVVREEFALRPE
jgi:hypothetical protein